MKIAVISAAYKATPPVGYGGIERVVHTYVEEMVRRGHDVVMFATPGSFCSGHTVCVDAYDPAKAPSGVLSLMDVVSEEPMYKAARAHLKAHPVDLVHDWTLQQLYVRRHADETPFLVSSCIPLAPYQIPPNVVACSQAHADSLVRPAPFVHYGLDLRAWQPRYDKASHLVHIAKVARYKAQHEALLAAARARRELWIAGNVENASYFRWIVSPMVKLVPRARYAGELKSTQDTLQQARALVQTPRWLDVLPLVGLEAMACGTPIIGYRSGGLVEEIADGETGFLVDGVSGLAEAMARIDEIDPRACRARAETHFSVDRMARDYERLFERVLDGERW